MGKIFETLHSVISAEVFNPVRKEFEIDVLSPLYFLGELKKMLHKTSSSSTGI